MQAQTARPLSLAHGVEVRRERPLWIESLLAIGWRVWRAPWHELEMRRATRELEGMSSHLLKDIGLSRHDVRRAVREGRAPLWLS